MSPEFRDGSWDEDIWKSIVEHNEYGISTTWSGEVLDIGAHIGSFSYLSLNKLGASRIVAVEPDVDNFSVLLENLKGPIEEGRVLPLNLACSNGTKASKRSENWPNTGGALYADDTSGVDCKPLGEILDLLSGPVLIKIDCEGCEFEAFLSISLPEKVHCVVGEYHLGTGHSEEELRRYFQSQGFSFASHGKDQIGLFGAHRIR